LDSRLLNSQFFGFWHDFRSEATNAWFGELGIDYFDPSHSPIGNDPSNFIDTYHLPEKGTSQAPGGSATTGTVVFSHGVTMRAKNAIRSA
jgi:hypothetical protein